MAIDEAGSHVSIPNSSPELENSVMPSISPLAMRGFSPAVATGPTLPAPSSFLYHHTVSSAIRSCPSRFRSVHVTRSVTCLSTPARFGLHKTPQKILGDSSDEPGVFFFTFVYHLFTLIFVLLAVFSFSLPLWTTSQSPRSASCIPAWTPRCIDQ